MMKPENDALRGCPPPAASPPILHDSNEANIRLATYAKALGHPARVAILHLLSLHEGCIVGDIVDHIPLAQSTISQHLKQLKNAGLIRGEIDGPRICYCIEPNALRELKSLIKAL